MPILGNTGIVFTASFSGPVFSLFYGNVLDAEWIRRGLIYGGSLFGGLLFHTFYNGSQQPTFVIKHQTIKQ